jgi:hypothetical protein
MLDQKLNEISYDQEKFLCKNSQMILNKSNSMDIHSETMKNDINLKNIR